MAAAPLTAVIATAYAKGVASAAFQAVQAGADGNYFANTGKTLLLVTRTGGAVNPTFKSIGPNKYTMGVSAATRVCAEPIADGKIGVYGPFPTAIYGTTVTVTFDTGTAVTAAVVELADNSF